MENKNTTTILTNTDHRPVKRRNKFYRSLRTASTTIKGMEAIRGLYKKTRKEGTLFGFWLFVNKD
ncbi:hypothetical protein [Enterococcus faecium]|uniref:hypothetical protein n=1 Tax=Enterococcus faecium TaxID=1352 RepID=UPI001C4AEEF2|nr:hypothetical protein [Enterococcus faecium]